MDFTPSDIHIEVRRIVETICRRYTKGPLPRAGAAEEQWRHLASAGLLEASIQGGDDITDASSLNSIIAEELGRHLCGHLYWTSGVIASNLLHAASRTPLQESLLSSLVSADKTFAVCDIAVDISKRLTVEPVVAHKQIDGHYILSGRKNFVICTVDPDFLICFTKIAEPDGSSLIGYFVVNSDTGGLTYSSYESIDGNSVVDVEFKNVRLLPETLLATGATAVAAFNNAIDQGMLALTSEVIGILDAAMQLTINYLKVRQQFGVKLSSMQALQHRLAEMFVEVELARSGMLRSLLELSHSSAYRSRETIWNSYSHACQVGSHVCKNAIQLHGAIGLTDEYIIGRYFKRVLVISQIFGSINKLQQQCFTGAEDPSVNRVLY